MDTEEQVRAWQGYVMELVRREGESKRTTARLASLGVNGAGLTVMLAVFAHTGGLTGVEVVVAGGTSALGQKVLEALFGDQAVRELAAQARRDLVERADELLRADAARFDALVEGAATEAEGLAPPARGGRRGPTRLVSRRLDRRLTALAEAVQVADGRLEPEAVQAARAVTEKAGARLGLGVETTVVALAGRPVSASRCSSTRSPGAELATVGRRRPTTSEGQAAVWGDGADPLLDWLEIGRRHRLDDGALSGLLLLDLPDFDSVETAHRLEVDRVVELADLVVWVVEPQKYADASCTTATCGRCRRTGRRWRSS